MQIPAIQPTSSGWVQTNDSLQIQEGQIFRALVQAVEGSDMILNIAGVHIAAKGQIVVEPGKLLWLQATTVEDGKLVLRTVEQPSSSAAESNTAGPNSATVNLSDTLLNELNLRPTPQNMAAAKALLKWLQPANKEAIAQLAQETRNHTPAERQAYLEVRSWAKAVDIADTRANIRVVTNLLLGKATAEEIPLALKLINSSNSPQQLDYPQLNLVWWGDQAYHGELYIFKDATQPANQNTQTKELVIHFYTPNMGQIWVRLASLNQGNNLVHVITESELGTKLFRQHSSSLRSLLHAAGLNISDLSIYQQHPQTVLNLITPPQNNYQGVNLVL